MEEQKHYAAVLGLDGYVLRDSNVCSDGIRLYVQQTGYRPVCPVCGSCCYHVHEKKERAVQDAPIHNQPTTLLITQHRYKCADCGKRYTELLNGIEENAKITNRLVDCVIRQFRTSKSFTQISDDNGISLGTAKNIFNDWAVPLLQRYAPVAPTIMGIDEAHLGHIMRGVITDTANNAFVDILPERSKKYVVDYLERLPGIENTEIVTMDMWRGYSEAVYEAIPGAIVIIDKFHVIKEVLNAMDDTRIAIHNKLGKELSKKLRKEKYLMRKNHEDLTPDEFDTLTLWLSWYPLMFDAYKLKEMFRNIYSCHNRKDAEQAFHEWEKSIPAPKDYEPFRQAAKTVRNWHPEIFNYFDAPYTNAFTESFNNKVKNIEKIGRGYSFDILRYRLIATETDILSHI